MKNKLIPCILTASLCVPMSAVPAYAQDTEPVLHYTFDSGDMPELKNGAQLGEGKSGKALVLDGTDDYALLPQNLLSDSMTVSAWVRQDKKNVWGRVFDLGDDSLNNFFFAPSSGGASRVEAKSGSTVDTMDSKEFESTGVWAYYAVTADSSGIRLYRDGMLISEKTDNAISLSDIKNTLNYIGKSHYDGDAYFAGAIDDFRIYDRVLSAEEILRDMGENTVMSDSAEIVSVYSSGVSDGGLILGDRIELPSAGVVGEVYMYWTSSDESVIDPKTGAVNPAEQTKEVTLAANTNYTAQSSLIPEYSREFTVTVPAADAAPFEVNIDAADRSKDISDIMWGLFFEDINSAADGGLYAELIQNQSFEYPDAMYSWSADGETEILDEAPLNENNTHYVKLSGGYIENDGYMGMSLEGGAEYDYSFFVKGSAGLTVQLIGDDESVIAEDKPLLSEGEEWTAVSGVLVPSAAAQNAKLRISADAEIYIDFVSLMPRDTYKGHGLRKDLCEALEAMQPKFLRFPGGCAVEGLTMELAYNWKDTVGKREERRVTENIWNTGAEPYIMSYGLGFYEYFQLCEDMGMEPVPILNCGIACQVRSGSSQEETYLVPMDELEPYIQDAIDLVQFANGTDMSNEWVQLRAEMGHPEPFNLKYIGIGNEQYGEIYFERYEAFAKALREAYPDMDLQLITSSGTASSGSANDLAWTWTNEHREYADVMDEHYYEDPDWFRSHVYRYDSYRRDSAKVFLGEYASKGNTWYNALSEAAFMTGLERNADVVRMASYAPMFAKYGNTQWTAADMIWFNNSDFVLTPNYYVQKLFSENAGDYSLPADASVNGAAEKKLSGGISIGTWKTQADFADVKIVSNADGSVLYEGGFDGWTNAHGDWTLNSDGSVSQSSEDESCIYYLDGDYSDCTITLRARKTGGKEGFLIGAALEDSGNMYWANIGGWTNTASKFQKVTDGAAQTISNVAEQSVTSSAAVKDNEWMDIRLVVSGSRMEAYVDGELACAFTEPESYGPVYTSAVYDGGSGEIIVKLVNTADADAKVKININNAPGIAPEAAVTVMSGDTKAANSLENKDNIVPRETKITNASQSFEYSAAANSFSIIHLKADSLVLQESGKALWYDASGEAHEVNMSYDGGVLTGVEIK